MHELYELKEKLMKELNGYAAQELSAGSLEVIDKLSHAIKNICKILEAAEEEEYSSRGSYAGGNMGGNRYSRERGSRNAYDGGQGGSYARGRNVRRDSMGRYTSRDGYSRTDGLEELTESIREMMQELPQGVQQDAQRFIQKLEQQM